MKQYKYMLIYVEAMLRIIWRNKISTFAVIFVFVSTVYNCALSFRSKSDLVRVFFDNNDNEQHIRFRTNDNYVIIARLRSIILPKLDSNAGRCQALLAATVRDAIYSRLSTARMIYLHNTNINRSNNIADTEVKFDDKDLSYDLLAAKLAYPKSEHITEADWCALL